MPTNFKPMYNITPGIAKSLMRIEAAKEKVALLPVNPTVLASLRETAKLYTTHYSTMIEGNQLKPDEIKEVIQLQGHFPGRERDEHEVKGYYAALAQLEQYASQNHPVTEKIIQIHIAYNINIVNQYGKPVIIGKQYVLGFLYGTTGIEKSVALR